jgi:hypothetical protein
MRKLLLIAVSIVIPYFAGAQCSTTNGTGCICEDGSNDCDLLPDITISWYAMESYMSGPNEYPQVCNPACSGNDGRLRITGSTPNIGHGSFTVRGSDYFVCGTDTTQGAAPSTCPDGSAPRQLIVQRVYHRDAAGNMTYTDRFAGAMTYHPTHGHNHVDDWGVFTLRLEDPNDPDPRNWPIVGEGAKLGFCLMDYGQCGATNYLNHCKDVNTVYQQGTTMVNADFPNWGLGGGAYNCSPVEQGISVGYTDVYSENLDGMWINIPPGTCNGNYWVVAIVDPHNVFVEEDDNNNYTAIPVTLTQQSSSTFVASITSSQGSEACGAVNSILTATTGLSYLWSTGDTTKTITVTSAGTYTCQVTSYCGTSTASFSVSVTAAPSTPTVASNPTVCPGQTASLSATGTNVRWFNASGAQVGTGNSFTTPALTTTTTYFAQDFNINAGTNSTVGAASTAIGGGSYLNNDQQYLIFNTTQNISINSVDVDANGAGARTFMVLDQGGNLVQGTTVNVPNGVSTVPLNFQVPAGSNYQMRVSGTANMYRNNTGVSYPYTDGTGTVTITGSSAGSAYYYYFYNWDINVGYSECGSTQSPSTVTVDACEGIDETDLSSLISVHPNPSNGEFTFTIDVPGTADFTYSIVDVFGKQVFVESKNNVTGKYSRNIDLSHLATGVYYLNLNIDGKNYFKKIVIS